MQYNILNRLPSPDPKDAAMKKITAAVEILLLSTSLAWAQVAPVADSPMGFGSLTINSFSVDYR
jgi:hypothetical protein